MPTRVVMVCEECGHTAKRDLDTGPMSVACRGVRESHAEEARCPRGHGRMVRQKKHWRGQT